MILFLSISRSRVFSEAPTSVFFDYIRTCWQCNLEGKPWLVFNISIVQKDCICDAVSDEAGNHELKIVSIWLYVEQQFKNSMIFGTLLSGGKSLKPLFLSTEKFSRNSPPDPIRIPGIPGSGVRKCCSDPTSTRAGGQDDAS